MRHFILLSLLLLQLTYDSAARVKFNRGTVTPNFYTEIPLEIVRGKLIVPVKIQGKTYRFLLDTGAPCAISPEILKTLDVKKIKKTKVGDGGGRKNTEKVIQVPSIDLGGVLFEQTPAIVLDWTQSFPFTCYELDGIIGSNLLRHCIMQLDKSQNKLILTDQEDKISTHGNTAFPVILDKQSGPFVTIEYVSPQGTYEELVLLDTGDESLMSISYKRYTELKDNYLNTLATDMGTGTIGLYGAGIEMETHLVQVPLLGIGEQYYTGYVHATTSDSRSRIGTKILDQGILTLDYKNEKFYFGGKDTVSMLKPYEPITRIPHGNKMAVGLVWDEELRAQLQAGDIILQENHRVADSTYICELLTQKWEDSDSTTLLIQKPDGSTREVSIQMVEPAYIRFD